ncbi:unnamed protein product [Closterium sp. Naga37s-1]|nr:unnamed protein product [Closterium sp. Naga37s-1]
MPPKQTTKAAVDVTLPDDLSTDPITTLSPDGDGAEKQGSDITINAPSATDIAAGIIKESATTAAAVAGGSGLTVEEKSQDNQAPTTVNDEFVEDDEDEELEIDIAKEDAFRLRYTAILLIPMVLSQEIKAIIAAVRLLMMKVWSSSLTENAGVTANIQEMTPGFVAKTRFRRLQISFLDERDAHHIKFHVFEYQKANAPAIKCIWQHTEDATYLKEKAARPLAIEVIFRRVPANIVPDVLKDLVVRFELKMPSSLRTSALVTPILKDPSIALISTGSNREEWIYTQVCCGKAKGKTFLAAADHIISATHLLNQEKLGTATKASMDKTNLADLKKDYNF